METNGNYKIWISYHRDELVDQYHLKEDEHHILFPTHKEPEQKNINKYNSLLSEMVTMWYVWHNQIQSDYVGFNHYRRQFPVYRMPLVTECQVWKIRDFGKETIYNQYTRVHNAIDMDKVLDILDDMYGKNNPYTRHIRCSHKMVMACCFLMTWNNFSALCTFLFNVILKYCHQDECRLSIEAHRRRAANEFGEAKADYQMRTLSFLSERLISAWIMTHLKPYQQKDICIIHYNTPEITEATIKSIRKYTPDVNITVFDNSDKYPFDKDMGVTVLDNTKGQLIDFEAMINRYPDRIETACNWGSEKHIASVNYLFDKFPYGFILMDSDVLVKKDLSPLFDPEVTWVGMVEQQKFWFQKVRLAPYLLYINTLMCSTKYVRFWHEGKVYKLSHKKAPYYDTGSSFLEDCNRNHLHGKEINIYEYIEHLGGASCKEEPDRAAKWLEEHKQLWKDI